MRGTTAFIAAVLAACTGTSAAPAASLVLYDYSAALGIDAGSDPYVDQKIQQQITSGLLRPLVAPISTTGVPLTTKVDILGGGSPYTRPGTQIQTGTIEWLVTTGMERGMLRWQVEIDRMSAYVGGAMPPTDIRSSSQVLKGMSPPNATPAVRAEYRLDGRTHVLTGYIRA